jgi:DNA repair protein RecN (Recombination protein N)
MLKQLYIRNFTLIEELNITFNSGFSVITGETGAGKSIILGAIGLLLGQRADLKVIKAGKDKCVIEAHFDLSRYDMDSFFTDNDIDYEPEDCIIRREINKNGKSRAFINDTPVQLNMMRELGEMLVDIHSQHQNLLLQKEDFQLNVVDIIAKDNKELKEYRDCFAKYHEAIKELQKLKDNIAQSRENEEFMRFQFDEINKAQLIDGEQETTEQETEQLSHSEEIKEALYESNNALTADTDGAVEQVKTAASRLQNIENVYPNAKELAERLSNCHIELKDIAQEISRDVENVDFDPDRLNNLTLRLDSIYSLEQKFHVNSIAELLAIRDDLNGKLENIDNSDDIIKETQQNVDSLEKECISKSMKLTKLRTASAKKVEKEMSDRLIPLGIPNVRFQIELKKKELSEDGADKISFLFSANKSTPLQPVSQVASGGEIARVMLSLKAMISGVVKLPTIIFDEIDTGVSGRVAEMMAQIMQEMGNNERQVISITHLPQIAALGSTHYKVEKEETTDGTISRMRILNNDERINEIAQMLSGSNISEEAISNAKALLKL